MARPGYFFIDNKGVIREKFFEAKYRERPPGSNVIAKLFPELGEEVASTTTEAPHLRLTLAQSDGTAFPGGLHLTPRQTPRPTSTCMPPGNARS